MADVSQADLRLISHAKTLCEGLAVTRARIDKAYQVWITADWRRLKAIEDSGSPNRITFLTTVANAAWKDYEEAHAYHAERLANAADYIRTEVRNG
jgi:hypothetical protein